MFGSASMDLRSFGKILAQHGTLREQRSGALGGDGEEISVMLNATICVNLCPLSVVYAYIIYTYIHTYVCFCDDNATVPRHAVSP